MVDIPAGWLALVGTVITTLGAAIGVFLRSKDKDIADRDQRIKDLQARVDSMQARQLAQLEAQLDMLRGRRRTDERLIDTLHEQSALVDKLTTTDKVAP
jgi:ABC-type phosphate transport system auxiliary subunit